MTIEIKLGFDQVENLACTQLNSIVLQAKNFFEMKKNPDCMLVVK
jgi:hypothetical protein